MRNYEKCQKALPGPIHYRKYNHQHGVLHALNQCALLLTIPYGLTYKSKHAGCIGTCRAFTYRYSYKLWGFFQSTIRTTCCFQETLENVPPLAPFSVTATAAPWLEVKFFKGASSTAKTAAMMKFHVKKRHHRLSTSQKPTASSTTFKDYQLPVQKLRSLAPSDKRKVERDISFSHHLNRTEPPHQRIQSPSSQTHGDPGAQ